MNMNKRFLSLTLAFVMILGSLASLTPVLAAETASDFTDVKETDWFFADVDKAVKNKLVEGYEDGTFKPNNELTRAEMVTILARAFELEDKASLDKFIDVKGHWAAEAFAKAVEAGIFIGDGNKLMPDANITREQAFATVARGLNLEGEELEVDFPDADEISSWFVKDGEVAALINLGFIEGNEKGMLEPTKTITRAEMVKIMNAALEYEPEEPEVPETPEELTVESVSAINPTTLLVIMSDGSAHEVVLENDQELVPGEKTEVSFAIDGVYYEEFVIYVEKSAELEKEIEKARAEFKEAVSNYEEAAQVAIDAKLDLVQAEKYGTEEEILAAEEALELAEIKVYQAGKRVNIAAEKLNDLINDTYVAIDYEKALAAVEKAERSNKKVDVTAARKLVNTLISSELKEDLKARLNYVDQVIVAKEQVVFIEGLVAKEDFNVNAASAAYTTVLGFVEALEDGAVKTDLENRLEAVKTIIDDAVTSYHEKQATKEVELAETNLDNLDYAGAKVRHDKALKLVKALEAGEVKTDLEARLTEVKKSVEADVALKGINKDSKQEEIDAAQELVTALKDGKVKESLQERLDVLYEEIATIEVEKAETNVTGGDFENAKKRYDKALPLVEALEAGEVKTDLEERLEAVEKSIIANAKVEAKAVEVAIAGLPTAADVTLTNGTEVIATNQAYNDLSDLAKGFVPAASKAKLDAVVAAYNAL